MPKSQQVAKIRQVLSNRGAGVDTLDFVDDLVDPTVGYEDNKREILRHVGFGTSNRYAAREMVIAQCPSAIAECVVNGEDPCGFACEECGDTPSCRKVKEIRELGGYSRKERVGVSLTLQKAKVAQKKKSVYVMFKGIKKHRMRCPKCGRAALDGFCIVHSEVKALDLELSKKAQKMVEENIQSHKERLAKQKKKVVKPTKPTKTPKVTKKVKVTTKPKKPKTIKTALHSKTLTKNQRALLRKYRFVDVSIQSKIYHVMKQHVKDGKVEWYKKNGKVCLKKRR